MNVYAEHPFVFARKYTVIRHVVFWMVQALVVSLLFRIPDQSFLVQLLLSILWIPGLAVYAYPVMYWFIPLFLLNGKYFRFIVVMVFWGLAGWFWNYIFRSKVYFPIAENLHLIIGVQNPWAPISFLNMNSMAGFGSMIVLFKFWMKKQQDFLIAENDKINAELQLLKAQVHPHFLFNTLNNIYAFALQNSPKTPQLVLKLSSLLSYILYDCKSDAVLLEKELQVMTNYIDLEKERYSRLEISLNIEGDIQDKWISPLLLLPFLENAFKHGTSEQLEKSWLNLDLVVKNNTMYCKIANSKNNIVSLRKEGIGIQNVKKRLAYLYPGMHDLKLVEDEDFYVVSLVLELKPAISLQSLVIPINTAETV